MTPTPLPTPDDLDHAPELAVLAVLDSALATAQTTLLWTHAELRSGDDACPHPQTAALWVARAMLPMLGVLGQQIERYRQALEYERNRRDRETAAITRF